MLNIDNLISEATKSRSLALPVYRLMKAEFLRWQKDNPGNKFDGLIEAKILKKMYDQRIESMKIYEAAGRKDLMENEAKEALFIGPYLPAEVPEEKIEKWTKHIIDSKFNGSVTMKDMKYILNLVQEKYPGTSGKIVSNVVKSYIK